MIEVFKITYNIYNKTMSPDLPFNERANTRGNHYKLQNQFTDICSPGQMLTGQMLTGQMLTGQLLTGQMLTPLSNKKLSYRRWTARCVVSIEMLPIVTQQCRNYLYDKSWPNRWYEVGDLVGGNA